MDCGERTRRATLRKAALVVSDHIKLETSFRVAQNHEQVNTTAMERWIKIDRFREGKTASAKHNHAHPGQSAIPYLYVLLLIVSVRAHQQSSWLFHCTQTRGTSPLATNVQTPQGFVDERASLNPTISGSIQNVDEDDDDDDERDDEMSGTTQVTRSEKRKEIQTDTTAKESRAVLSMTDPSQSSLLNPLKKPKDSSNGLRNQPFQHKRESRRIKMSRIFVVEGTLRATEEQISPS